MNDKNTQIVKHTPGPWMCCSSGPVMNSYHQPFAIAQDGELNLVAGVFSDCRGGEEVAAANARLIAAAPELLEACKLANEELLKLGVGSSASQALQALWKALAKAEGTIAGIKADHPNVMI